MMITDAHMHIGDFPMFKVRLDPAELGEHLEAHGISTGIVFSPDNETVAKTVATTTRAFGLYWANPASAGTAQLTDALTAAAADLVAALPGHRWLAAMADGSLPDEAFGRWPGQRRLLASWQRQALMTLRSYNPPAELERWLNLLADETVHERRRLAHSLEQIGARAPRVPLPTCLGYGAYTRCCAADGLVEGLTALYAAHRAALEAWAGVAVTAPVSPARRPWVVNWAAPEFREVVTGLGEALTELAGQPGQVPNQAAVQTPPLDRTDPRGRCCHARKHVS
jgi:thiaminase